MDQSISNLFFIFLLFVLVHGQNAQSPCPDYFEYKNDQTGVYGILHIYPRQKVSSVLVRVNFTIAAKLSSGYLGKLETIGGSDLQLIQQFGNGKSIDYRLHFPVSSPIPKVTSISVNDDLICTGFGDTTASGTYVTTISLQHKLYLKDTIGGSGYAPVVSKPTRIENVFGNGQPFPSFLFETNNNNPSWSYNAEPFFLINNSQLEFSSNRQPSKPYDFNKDFYTTQPPRQPVFWNPPAPTPRPRPPPPPPQAPPPQPETTTTTTTPRPQQVPRPLVDNNQCGVNNVDSAPLIFNGMSYIRGEWPWVVAIFKRKDVGLTYICSGTLISNRHVITAAHCMHRGTLLTSMSDIVVKAGVHNLLDWDDGDVTVTRVISSATIHENYNASTLVNDILMLKFTRAVEFNAYIKAACLWSGNTDLNLIVGVAGVVTGWGVSEIGPAGTGDPRMVRMPVVSTTMCRASKPEFHKLTSSKTLCAGDRNGSGPCFGDSGGGLYIQDKGRWKLRGIVSLSLVSKTGDRTCDLNEYIVFTDAAKYLTWIQDNMGS